MLPIRLPLESSACTCTYGRGARDLIWVSKGRFRGTVATVESAPFEVREA